MGEAKISTAVPHARIAQLLRAARADRDALLELSDLTGGPPLLRLRVQGGRVVDLEARAPEDRESGSLLSRILGECPALRERDLRRLRREAQSLERDLGSCILESGLLPPETISETILAGIDRAIAVAFDPAPLSLEELPEGPLQQGLLGCIELDLTMETALLRGARGAGRWDIARELPCLHEVCGATTTALEVFREPERFGGDATILEGFDGRLDLAEVIEASGLEPWATFDRTQDLLSRGYLQGTNPVQLFQLGCEEQRSGSWEKALRLFQHAEHCGLDDFDLGQHLAEVLAELGRTEEALRHYHSFAEKCIAQFRIEDTIAVHARILELEPGDLVVQERYISLLARYGRGDEAISSGLDLARALQESGEETRARALLEQLAEHADGNEEVLRLYRELCLGTADPEGAHLASRKLGQLYLEREDLEAALQIHRDLFAESPDDPVIRSQLVELHFRLGRRDSATEHLIALHEMTGWGARQPSESALEFHRRLLDLGVEDPSITAWLSEAARAQESQEDSAHYLQRHRDLLREAGDEDGARLAAAELVRLRPADTEAARTLSDLEWSCGHPERAGVVLEELVRRWAQQEEGPPAAERRPLLELALERSPASSLVRRALIALTDPTEERQLRNRLHLEVALIALATGDDEAARECVTSMVPPPPLAGVLDLCAGIRAEGGGAPTEDALEHFRRGGRHAGECGDQGLLRDLAARLESLSPDDESLEELRRARERAPAPTAPPALGRSPQVVKSSISGITQKLRGLKDGDGSAAPTPSGGVGAALARLKSLQGAGPEVPAAGEPAGTEDTTAVTPGTLGGETPPADRGTSEPLPPPPPPKSTGEGVNAALAKLRGIKSGPEAPGSAPAASGAAPVDPPATESTGDAVGPAPLPPPPEPSAAGGGVKSALARLRSLQGGGTAPSAEAKGADQDG